MDIMILKDLVEKYGYEGLNGKRFGVQDQESGNVVTVTLGPKQFVFLHIPKTAGTYIARNGNVLEPIFDLNHSVLVEMPYKGIPEYPPDPGYRHIMREDVALVKNPYTICFSAVRNPFDWFVSYWYHAHEEGHYDFDIANKSFDYFLKSIANREKGWPSSKLLFFALFEYNDNFVVDYLLHQENLDIELEEFANKFYNLQYQKNEKRARVSANRQRDYRFYYTDSLISLVNKTWERDLFLFGYDFNGKVSGFFEKNVTDSLKQRVKYIWETNKLFIDNREVSGRKC